MSLLDLIFPKKCVGCGKLGKYVCDECEVGMWEEEQICPSCGRASQFGLRHKYCNEHQDVEGLTCFWAYEGIARRLIKQSKYKFYFDYLREFTIYNFQFTNRPEFMYFRKFLEERPVLVPIPLYKDRLKERGFNQAEIICQLAGNIWHLNYQNCLIRVRDTGRQVNRTRKERLAAMRGAFQFEIRNLKIEIPKSALLVDDVWTTGATMREAAKVLREAGVERIWGLALAR